ncbi:MAG: hypothetical protein ACXWC9_00115 [Pseudobdellovibrionaceae bacterium]
MKKIIICLSVAAIVLAMAACGKNKNDDAAPLQESPQILSFNVGTDFTNAPYTHVVISDIKPGSTHTKKILFRAPRIGTFSLSETNHANGTGCTNPDQNGDYDSTFDYKIKDPRTNQFNLMPMGTTNNLLTTIRMNAGDELMVTMKINGKAQCTLLDIYLSAVFN